MPFSDMPLKELLEGAAKACNHQVLHWVDASHFYAAGLVLDTKHVFNPAHKVEQALWLNVDLCLNLKHENNSVIVEAPWAGIEPQVVVYGQEPMAAVCRALTQAAAAIASKGLTMKDIPA